MKRGARYKLSPKDVRTWRGCTYASKLEMNRHKFLEALRALGWIIWIAHETSWQLGEGVRMRPDFMILWTNSYITIEDAKGHTTDTWHTKKAVFETMYSPLAIDLVKEKDKYSFTPEQAGPIPQDVLDRAQLMAQGIL